MDRRQTGKRGTEGGNPATSPSLPVLTPVTLETGISPDKPPTLDPMATESVSETQQRALALNTDDQPFVVSAEGDTIVATWKYLDVKWSSIIAGQDIQAGYRLTVTFDPDKGTYDTDEVSEKGHKGFGLDADGNVSIGGGKSAFKGKQWGRSAGGGAALHVKQDGQDAGQTYHYSFSTATVKDAVLGVVEGAGWSAKHGLLGRLFRH